MKIKAKNENIRSIQLQVPCDGLIEIDKDGCAEVSDRCGQMLIEGTNDWCEFEPSKNSNKKGKAAEQAKIDDEKADNEPEDETEGDEKSDDEVINGLNSLSLEDCIQTAKEANYPKKEWEKFSKNEKAAEKLMRAYLIKKYKASQGVAEND